MDTRNQVSARQLGEAPGYDDPDAATNPARGRRLWSSKTLATFIVLLLLAIAAVTTMVWRSTAEPPHLLTGRENAGAALVGDTVFVVGGLSLDGDVLGTVEALAGSSSSWSSVPALPIPVHRPAVTAFGDELYALGGFTETSVSSATDAVQVYDRTTNQWRVAGSLPEPVGGAAAVTAGARIYLIGGAGPTGTVGRFLAYSPSTREWHELPAMPTPRHSLAAGAIGARIHAVGGFDGSALAVHEVYDLDMGSWSELAALPGARADAAAAVSGTCLVVTGGFDAAGVGSTSASTTVVSYASSSDAWAHLTDLPGPRRGASAAQTANGDVLVIGGIGAAASVTRLPRPLCPTGG